MYLIRDVFQAKPGKAKFLVKMFKESIPYFEKSEEGRNFKVMTDIASNYWTVVLEFEVENIGAFIGNLRNATMAPELQEIMKGYLDLIEGGNREIFILE